MALKKILCFGDSLTEGWINDGKNFYPYTKKLQALLNSFAKDRYKVINSGISGETAVHMCERVKDVLKEHKNIDVLIIQGGTNDILQFVKPDVFKSLCNIVHNIPKDSVNKICLLTIMEGFYTEADDAVSSHSESNRFRIEINNKLRQHDWSSKNVSLCDLDIKLPLFSLSEDERKMYWDDNLHPSPNGYDKMAEIIFDHLKFSEQNC